MHKRNPAAHTANQDLLSVLARSESLCGKSSQLRDLPLRVSIYEAKESSRSDFQYRVALRRHVRMYRRGVWRINPGSQYWSYWSQFI